MKIKFYWNVPYKQKRAQTASKFSLFSPLQPISRLRNRTSPEWRESARASPLPQGWPPCCSLTAVRTAGNPGSVTVPLTLHPNVNLKWEREREDTDWEGGDRWTHTPQRGHRERGWFALSKAWRIPRLEAGYLQSQKERLGNLGV